jgi:hypothetical protein
VLTVLNQLGLGPVHDFVVLAFAGLAVGIIAVIVSFELDSRRALAGAAMSFAPVVLLVYYVLASEG